MRLIFPTLLASLFMMSTACPAGNTPLHDGVWSAIVDLNEGSNFVCMRLNGSAAKSVSFYPNDGKNRTVCRHSGSVKLGPPDGLEIKLAAGDCENGMRIADEDYACKFTSSDQLTCFIDGTFKIIFSRE